MDARVRYTQNIIKRVMFELLEKIEIEKITVTEICKLAQVNRATFYKYFDNPYDLLNKMEQDFLDRLELKLKSSDSNDLSYVFTCVLTDIKENYQYYKILFSENGDDKFKERLFNICYRTNIETINELFKNLDEKKKRWLYFFIAEGCNGVLSQWLNDGMSESISYVVDFLQSIIYGINKSCERIV